MFGQNLPDNFPVIDRFINGVATSIKSIDLRAPTYENISILTRTVREYISVLVNWQGVERWAGITIETVQIRARELLLAIRPVITQAQVAGLQELQQWAAKAGVILNIRVVP